MHSRLDGVVAYLTEVPEISTECDGTSREETHHAGDVIWSLRTLIRSRIWQALPSKVLKSS